MPYEPPHASLGQLAGVDFSKAKDFAVAAKSRFDAKDNEVGNKDPSKCKALLKFPGDNGPVFWSAKMAIDTDGPAAREPGRRTGKQLDPANGQNATSYHPYGDDGLAAEVIPYIVLPEIAHHVDAPFDPVIALGDMAIVIFKDKITAAICGDLGPFNKIGEASIRVHENLSDGKDCPDPCVQRTGEDFCFLARDNSVDEDVLYFVFPNSSFPDGTLTYDNINAKIKEKALDLFNSFRGA